MQASLDRKSLFPVLQPQQYVLVQKIRASLHAVVLAIVLTMLAYKVYDKWELHDDAQVQINRFGTLWVISTFFLSLGGSKGSQADAGGELKGLRHAMERLGAGQVGPESVLAAAARFLESYGRQAPHHAHADS